MQQVFKIDEKKVKQSAFRKHELLIKKNSLTEVQMNLLRACDEIQVVNSEQDEIHVYEIKHVRRGHSNKKIHVKVRVREIGNEKEGFINVN